MGRRSAPTAPGPATRMRLVLASEGARFCLRFTAFSIVAFAAVYAGQRIVVNALNDHLATVAAWCLRAVGASVHASGPTVAVATFAVEIKNNCNAIYETALFAAAVWAYPAPRRERAAGLAAGAVVLYVVNMLRILSLIAIGAYAREWFEVAHFYVWQLAFLSAVAACWLGWAVRVRRLA